MKFCSSLAKEREKSKITLETLSKLLLIPQEQIRCYERGLIAPSVEMLDRMCDLFKCHHSIRRRLHTLLQQDFRIKIPEISPTNALAVPDAIPEAICA